jgi:hypothetical protein
LKVLTSIEARIVEALGETLFPKEGSISLGAGQAHVVEYVDDFMCRIPARDRWLVRGMFLLFEVSIAAFGPERALRFSTASPAARRAYLASWENAELYFRRVAFQALRSIFTMAYMADPEVGRQMGVEDGMAALRRYRASLAPAPVPAAIAAEPPAGEAPLELRPRVARSRG